MNAKVRHFYRQFRDHQNNVYASGGGMVTTYRSGRVELSYGSAPYGEHAASAFVAAKRHVAFLARMKKELRK